MQMTCQADKGVKQLPNESLRLVLLVAARSEKFCWYFYEDVSERFIKTRKKLTFS